MAGDARETPCHRLQMDWQGRLESTHLPPEPPSDLRHSFSPRTCPKYPSAWDPGGLAYSALSLALQDRVTTLLFLYGAFRLEFRLC